MRIVSFVSVIFVSVLAQGHIMMKSPLPRPPNRDNLKQDANNPDPCGSRNRGNTPIVYTPNEMVTFSFTETIEHPGRFKVQFSMANDEGFDVASNTLATLEDTVRNQEEFTMQAKMPNVECDGCTLRVIQEMDEQPGQIYVNCIDIQLKGALSGGGEPVPVDEGANPNDGTVSPQGNEPGEGLAEADRKLPQMGGCGRVTGSSGGGGGPMGGLTLLLLPLMLLIPIRRQTVREKANTR